MKKYLGLIIILICLSFFYNAFALKQGEGKDKNKVSQTKFLPKTAADPVSTVLDINNITSWITSDGFMPAVVGQSWNGTFPKGTVGAIYQEGIVWGGIVNDGQSPPVRVGGNTYIGGTTRLTRVVRVRPDYATADLTDDAANFFLVPNSQVTDGMISQIRDQYAKDWLEWPANLGAPYFDRNNSGAYEPNRDIPGIPGASQTIFVSYDDRNSVDNYGSAPIGLKVNETLWAYAIANPLGNVIFKKVQVIYQGTPNSAANSTIDSMYFVQWADPDVGQYTDDFAGSDSTLGLGYAYNSTTNDAIYSSIGSPPPAVGYDFLQGVAKYTGNASDSAIVNLKWRRGYKFVNVNASGNPLSTFVYFAAGGAWGDPSFNYTGTLQWYNLMKGYQPRPPYPSQKVFPASVTNKPQGGDGTYLLSGDPVAGTGQIDGVAEGAGDRRIVCVTGPFSLAKGDTAEIVVALIGGIGSNNLTSISVLKFYDKFAQFAYDNLFNLPVYPPPTVAVTNLDGKILLNWSNQNNLDNIETPSHSGYTFQGYNVYQLPSVTTDLSKAVRVATFDVIDNVTTILDDQIDPKTGAILQVPVEFGKNTGISRFITLSNDAIRGNIPMANGQSYYFAVTAYGYNPDPNVPYHALESSPVPLTGIPQSPNPGVRYTGVAGDTLKVTHTTTGNKSDGVVVPIVIDPTLTTGNPYKVTFDASGNWSLTNVATGKALLTNQTNQSGDGNYLVLNGLQVKVIGPPPGVKPDPDGWSIPKGVRRFTWANAGFGFEAFGSPGALGYASPFTVFGGGNNPISPSNLNNVLLKLAKVPDGSKNFDPVFDPADPNMSYGYRYGRGFANAPAKPEFAAHIINKAGGYSFQDFTLNVPLSAWNVDDPANPKRLAVGWLENNAANGLVDGKYWPGDYTVYDNVAGNGPREWLFIFNTPYTTTADPNLEKELIGNPVPIMYWATWNRRGAVPFSPAASGDDQFAIFPTRPNSTADVFAFTAPAVTTDNNLAKQDVNKVNVFPNPYYGFQSRETSRTDKYVTFNHLPAQATLRIFDLAGVQVRKLEKNDNSQFITWDLRNQNNYPVASGIYVVYIDMPGVGATKILKLAVVQEEQILNVY